MLFNRTGLSLFRILLVGLAWSVPVASTGMVVAAEKTVRVFILAGQSNMEGAGQIRINPKKENKGAGSLEFLVRSPRTARQLAHTVDKDGGWVVRDDVWIWYLGRHGGLTAGYGARKTTIGPEFQFGHVVGRHFRDPVLIIKTAWGGKSLARDFRPPSAGGEVGPFYRKMIAHVREVLAAKDDLFPALKNHRAVLSGFGWHQGWNDGLKMPWVREYEQNMVHLIADLRRDLKAAGLPVVIANSGFGGIGQKVDRRVKLVQAQAAVAHRPELKSTVTTFDTRPFFRPAEQSPSRQGYHWNGNAETYFLIGDAMAREMIKLVASRPGSLRR